MIKKIGVKTESHTQFKDITSQVKQAVSNSTIKNGLAVVYVTHTTAGITINEHADPAVREDIITSLDKRFPWEDSYRHAEGNSAAHIKASLMGSSVTVIIENGSLVLGTWQGIFFCEFDGPRSRNAVIKIIESE
ncbi:MAG: YjbQ family protein [candidate division Zixibacteria bacterium]|nr:YjbQ family protein [candidate division Zixibacteria bacterium]